MRKVLCAGTLILLFMLNVTTLWAQEVGKGKIPQEQLSKSYKTLPWGGGIWDINDAVAQLKKKENMVWVDTRPASFFKKGTVRNAVLLTYNQSGKEGNQMTKASLEAAITKAGLTKDNAKIVFFCQGPKCHRSYNAAYTAVTNYGFPPENIIWFRDGYPPLLKTVKNNPKLKRKAKKYLCDAGLKQL